MQTEQKYTFPHVKSESKMCRICAVISISNFFFLVFIYFGSFI